MFNFCLSFPLVFASDDIKAAVGDGGLPVSVKTGWGIAQLQQQIIDAVSKATGLVTKRLLVPMNGPHIA